ncbi:MAG: EAL domain-containing protein [Ktedonobacteraceae bacterium]|nr:EAL domain-containing protein [Ktedonobacteraceae bacterium]
MEQQHDERIPTSGETSQYLAIHKRALSRAKRRGDRMPASRRAASASSYALGSISDRPGSRPRRAPSGPLFSFLPTGASVAQKTAAERKLIEEALHTSEARLQMVISHAPIALFAMDQHGIITLSEGQGLQRLGLQPGQVVGTSVFDLYGSIPQALEQIRRALAGEDLKEVVHIGKLAFETQFTPLHDTEGQLIGVIGVATDVTERTAMDEALRYQALYDALTGLPNRTLLCGHIEQAFKSATSPQHGPALLMLDINRFREINDTFGQQQGDLLLQQVGTRFRETQDASDTLATVARLGGDEFAVLLPLGDEESARQAADVLQAVLEEPFSIEGLCIQVEVSIGAALAPRHGSDAPTLLRRADVAMYTAKQAHEKYALYDVVHDQYNPQRLALICDLRQAIVSRTLTLHYQPKADLTTGKVLCVEALLRWHHPTRGFVPPDQFIPLAEQSGLIASLSHMVLETAIQQCRLWIDSGFKLEVAVNLSMRNLLDTKLPDTIADLLARYGVPGRLLCVEVTESAMMTNVERTHDVLMRLFEQGVRISIDDFGTGYSSLAYLKRLPIDELKIDRCFVQYMTSIRSDSSIVRSTVLMAHRLGVRVVAEGVENQETWDLLASMGCDIAQGYYLSRALPAPELEDWLNTTFQAVRSSEQAAAIT